MDVSCITLRQIVYWLVDVPSSVSKSWLKSLSHLQYLAYASSLKNWALGRGVWRYNYLGGTPSILEVCAPSLATGRTGGSPGGCGVGSVVGCLVRRGGGAPVPLQLQRVWGFCAVLFCQGRQPAIGFSRCIARSLSIATFASPCPGVSTARFCVFLTPADGFSIK